MIQITPFEVAVQPHAVKLLGTEFAETGCAMLPGFLSPPLLKIVMKQVETAGFAPTNEVYNDDGRVFGTTLRAQGNDPAIVALNFILNRRELFELVTRIADIPRPGSFLARLHRTTADSVQKIDWHDDAVHFRTLGLDINLSSDVYQGGIFQIRGPDQRVRRQISAWTLGDAFLFKIGKGWQHRLTSVESGERTVGVGWFRTQPDWQIASGLTVGALPTDEGTTGNE